MEQSLICHQKIGGFARVSNRFGVDIKIVDALSGEIRRAESIVAVIETWHLKYSS